MRRGQATAALFARQYNLTAEAQQLIERVIASKAKEEGHIHPLLSLNVTVPGEPPRTASLDMYEGDALAEVVGAFAAQHKLSEAATVRLQRALLQQLKDHRLAEPILELSVDLGGARGSVPLALYEGELMEQVAAEFAAAHGLTHVESEGVLALLEEQLTTRGLLPPLLFKLPVALEGSARVVQLSVHVGDDPAVLAEAFVQRHAAELWPAIESTRLELQATIEDNIRSWRENIATNPSSSLARNESAPAAGVGARTPPEHIPEVVPVDVNVGAGAASAAAKLVKGDL